MNKTKIICGTVIICMLILMIGLFGISRGNYTVEFKMDEETRDYLVEHDYCMYSVQPSYDSEETGTMFMGDCKYLNSTIIQIT
jgi:hypothetical protein